MDGFKNLEIKNFRGINHLVIEDSSHVNVFLGQNNLGKITASETICLSMGMSDLAYQQEMKLYTIANTLKSRQQVYKYTCEDLFRAAGNDIEIRGIV